MNGLQLMFLSRCESKETQAEKALENQFEKINKFGTGTNDRKTEPLITDL